MSYKHYFHAAMLATHLDRVHAAITTKGGLLRTFNSSVRKLRTLCATPLGVGNSKTACLSTYRKVGLNCPTTCPYLNNGCYAEGGRVDLVQKRCQGDPIQDAITAVSCIYVAGLYDEPFRFNVSGDLYHNGRLDRLFMRLVAHGIRLCEAVLQWRMPRGWTYTHASQPTDLAYIRSWSEQTGIAVRISDYVGEGGAMVYPLARIADLRQRGLTAIACPAQTGKVASCRTCKVCWSGVGTVIFDPHGNRKKQVEAIALS